MKFTPHTKPLHGHPLDIAPIASLFFTLATLMICTNLLTSAPGVKIQLPQLNTQNPQRPTLPKIDIAIDAQNKIYYQSQPLNHQQLRQQLQTTLTNYPHKTPTLILQADQNANLQTILQTCQIAIDAGIQETYWTTRQPTQPNQNQNQNQTNQPTNQPPPNQPTNNPTQ